MHPAPFRRPVTALLAVLSLASAAFAGLVPQASQSSPIALVPGTDLLLNANPDSGSITAFDVSADVPDKLWTLKVGGDPNSIAVRPDGLRAYVSLGADAKVAVVDIPHKKVDKKFSVGEEPSAVALSPNGTRLYVANSSSNTVTVFDTSNSPPNLVGVVDVSASGNAPRALAVTNDGDADDADETVFVALFFAQLRAGKTANDEGQDDAKEGRVVGFSTATNALLGAPNPVVLAPLAVTGFNSNGRLAPAPAQVPAVASTNPQTFTTPTGAFPNQLAAIAIRPQTNLAYVASTGASPNGPFRFNSNAQGLVSVFDPATRLELTAAQTDPTFRRTAPLNLNQGVNLATTPAPRLFFSNPVAMAWRPDGSDAWIVAQQADCVVRMNVDVNGTPSIAAPLVAGPSSIVRVDLHSVGEDDIEGKAPRGIVINLAGTRAYVSNLVSRSISVIDISNPSTPLLVGTAKSAKTPKAGSDEAEQLLGQELFYSGRGPDERMSSEAWGACIVCHPNGRSDNVTWMFDTGPRQTIALDGMFASNNPKNQRILNWSAVRDENQDFELNTRGVFGGRGLIDDDRLFFAIGGAFGADPSDLTAVEQFQQFTGAVTATNALKNDAPLPTLATGRRDFAIATLGDDRVFVFGGRTGSGDGTLVGASQAVLEFNPRKNKLKAKSSTGFTRRHSLGAAAVETADGPRIYVIGGYTSTTSTSAPVSTVEEYDPKTDTWRTVASLGTAVAQFGICVAGGVNTAEPFQQIHVVSGNTGSEAAPSVANATPVQRFFADPAGQGVWNLSNPGITLRRNHGAATALRGVASRIFVIGGQDAAGTVLTSVEEYNAQALTLVATTHTALPSARARFGIASTTTTNQIYVCGGVDGAGADQAAIFEYTVANNGPVAGPAGTPSGTWVTRGNLFAGRRSLQLSNPPGVNNFLVVGNGGRDERQDAIAKWIAAKVRPATAPLGDAESAVLAGKTLFEQVGLVVPDFSCTTCHGGAKWTRSIVDFDAPPSPEVSIGLGDERVIGAELRQTLKQGSNVLENVGTFTLAGGRTNEVRFNAADVSQAIAPLGANGFNIPSLLSVHETGPYFYNGLARTLDEVLDGSKDGNGGTRFHFVADATQRANLIAFLRSIDADTKPFK